jgi:hypothetical protein
MGGMRYRIGAGHDNARAYRQFYGYESRTLELNLPGAKNRFKRALRYARALIQRIR